MKKLLQPTYFFNVFNDITADFLKSNGFKGILTDLDSTLTEHNCPKPDADLVEWIKNVTDAGIRVCIVSNNRIRRIYPFAKKLDIPCICNAFKPDKTAIKQGLTVINRLPCETLFIGDQLYTDIKGAESVGIRSALVEPVGTKTTSFIKFKRFLEKVIHKRK